MLGDCVPFLYTTPCLYHVVCDSTVFQPSCHVLHPWTGDARNPMLCKVRRRLKDVVFVNPAPCIRSCRTEANMIAKQHESSMQVKVQRSWWQHGSHCVGTRVRCRRDIMHSSCEAVLTFKLASTPGVRRVLFKSYCMYSPVINLWSCLLDASVVPK